MSTNTVNIAFEAGLLREIDALAKIEFRSRSEFIREAARYYIERKRKWQSLLQVWEGIASESKITADDVEQEIMKFRKDRNA